ncbi:FKBP-type peptidyl-prolyl cis-trans isomerase [Pedobacter sp. BAL39]|uniref:FKBP-type peptidyl-prolyl cis-trans isomerase n=1 Tax=Pedobacter sp. BAL39 TaxID=391596 RepID=UPI000155994E|nr:FKBP-type peptidyl-prolyl cis-trans isomerase [Pedobacter sp. BAL39]EDM35720.1 FKBP-type peptidyl-prolyl cis-trans isomerase [Pedobacter sp. BAL39]
MIKKLSLYTIALFGALLLLNSCKKDYEDIQTIDNRKLSEYLAANNIIATPDSAATGYYYVVNNPATGDFYKNTDSILYESTMKSLLSGTVYSSPTANSNLANLVGYVGTVSTVNIAALREVMLKMKPGGSARIFVPSYLAFGKNGNTTLKVPSNDLIEFEITAYAQRSQAALDQQRIADFLTAKNLTGAVKPAGYSGATYIVETTGDASGEAITMASTLTMKYTGRLLDGTQFDSSTDGTFTGTLAGLISGWEVLKEFKKGAKIRLFVPSVLGYGITGSQNTSTGVYVIPPNATLDFDIEIVDVDN